MNCKKAQELILTDYLDNQMNEEERIGVKLHLAHCRNCEEFFLAAKKTVFDPFAGLEKKAPPEFVWFRIKENIPVKAQRRASFAAYLLEKLRPLVYNPRPALAVLTAVSIVVLAGVMARIQLNNQEFSLVNTKGQIEYFSRSIEAPADVIASEEIGFGTQIEKYFL